MWIKGRDDIAFNSKELEIVEKRCRMRKRLREEGRKEEGRWPGRARGGGRSEGEGATRKSETSGE